MALKAGHAPPFHELSDEHSTAGGTSSPSICGRVAALGQAGCCTWWCTSGPAHHVGEEHGHRGLVLRRHLLPPPDRVRLLRPEEPANPPHVPAPAPAPAGGPRRSVEVLWAHRLEPAAWDVRRISGRDVRREGRIGLGDRRSCGQQGRGSGRHWGIAGARRGKSRCRRARLARPVTPAKPNSLPVPAQEPPSRRVPFRSARPWIKNRQKDLAYTTRR